LFRTRTHVGVYVDDAPGPIARATAIVPHLRSQVTLLSRAELAGDAFEAQHTYRVRLPRRAAEPGRAVAGPTAPRSLGSAGAAELLAWMEQESPDLLFVDGPADVAIFARLAGVQVVLLQRHGRRTPTQQQLLDRAALGMLAPYPEDLGYPDGPASSRTVHTGLLSRFSGRAGDRDGARRRLGLGPEDRLVTVLGGEDGLGVSADQLDEAVSATQGWRWHVLGGSGPSTPASRGGHDHRGWVADPWPHLLAADVVISGASLSSVAEVADAGIPLVVVPRRSSDGAERRFADALGRLGAAVPLGSWPPASRWAATLDAAAATDPSPLSARCDGRAATRAAEWLDAWAAMPATKVDNPPSVTEELDLILDSERPAVGATSTSPSDLSSA
jgi:UDP-N-acetylglucosamine--N-acetylmuramyl-(pentapeptide) pyrophosphoryl-undecaprenol N-acetylglucosamine transferase